MQEIGLTFHRNYYLVIDSFLNICYFIKLFASKFAFYEQLEKGDGKSLLPDFFAKKTASLVKKIILANYISNLQDN